MRKLFSLIAAVLFAGSMMAVEVTDVLDNALTGVSGTNYAEWSGKQATSQAVYAGQSAGGNSSIQLRSNNNNSGVVTTASGGTLKSITVKFNSNTAAARVLDIYASNTAYAAATDLYGDNAGTKVVSFKMEDGAEQSYTFEETYTFFGFRSNSGALYLDEVDVVWVTEGEEVPATGIELDQPVLALKEFETATLVATLTPEGATTPVEWTSSDETVATVANGKVTAVAVGSAIITATAGEFSATCPVQVEAAPLLTCAEFAALEKGAKAKLNEVVVTFAAADGKNIWLRDETGSLLLYYAAGGYELKAGDVVNGLVGTLTTYQTKVIELIPTVAVADLQVTEGEAPAPEEFTAAPTDADINKYVAIKGVTFTTAEFESKNITATIGEETFTLRNNFNADQVFDTEKTYDITGLVSYYSNAVQVYFISAAEAEEKPIAKDTVGIAMSKGLIFVDYTSDPEAGWWDIYGANEEYTFEISNLFAEQAEGMYAIEDLDPDFTYIVPAETGDTVRFTDAQLALTIVEDTVIIAGDLLGQDDVLYRFLLVYTDPVAEDTVVVEIPEAELYDEYAALGLYGIYGFTEDENTYVQLGIWAEEFEGEFTEDDLDNEYIGSFIKVGDNYETIFSAAIEVIPGDGEGVYKVTADLLCYNGVLYQVTMLIGEEEEGVEETEAAVKAIKAIKNGQIIIEKNGVKYNVLGTRL